jgi:hypothetical protein
MRTVARSGRSGVAMGMSDGSAHDGRALPVL